MKWEVLTRRTEEPKLTWLEKRLNENEIPCLRSGYSFHAPILKVPEQYLAAAWEILGPVDHIPDDDPQFTCNTKPFECNGCENCCGDDCTGCDYCYEDDTPMGMGWIGKDGQP